MKKLIVICAAAIAAISSYGQGKVAFANSSTTLLTTNKTSGVAAAGSISGAGNYIVGIFFGAPGQTDPMSLAPAGYATNSALAGRFANSPLTTTTPDATTVAFQVRAWSKELGYDWPTVVAKLNPNWSAAMPWTTSSFATEATAGAAAGYYFGMSTFGSVTVNVPPATAPATFGVAAGQVGGFPLNEIHPVPEPSTIALGDRKSVV